MNRPAADEIRRLLLSELAAILNLSESEIDPVRSFDEYGLDSMDAVIVVGLVEERLNVELEPDLLLRNHSVQDVVRALQEAGLVQGDQ